MNQDASREPTIVPVGTVVRKLRMDFKLTLDALASRSGLGKRTIQQIERSEGVRISTLELVATALSVPLHVLTFDIVETTHRLIDRLYFNYKPEALHLNRDAIHDDVSFWISGDRKKIPFAGKFHRFEGAVSFFEKLFSVIELRSMDVPARITNLVVDHSTSTVVVDLEDDWVRLKGKPQRRLSCKVKCTFRYTDGRLIYFEDLFDTAAWEEFLGSDLPAELFAPPPPASRQNIISLPQ
ncbi:MAG: helix-turn-helix domain-containing protein [Planctomycetaceae bacterium]|nr:helix-turn-helix domain-containing protein [Planctomycetaceae bacterium]